MESNPYKLSSPISGATKQPNSQDVARPFYSAAKAISVFVSIPCWLGSLLFTLVGAIAILESDFPPHILLSTASGTTALTFLIANQFARGTSASLYGLVAIGAVAVIASAADHSYRQVQIDSLGPDCGLAAIAHLIFSAFWLSTYVCVPGTLCIRLSDLSRTSVAE